MVKENVRARMVPVVMVCLIFIGVAAWVSVLLPDEPVASTEPQVRTDARELGEWDGMVALFEQGGTEPIEVYDIAVRTLPEEEQARIYARIMVKDDAALENLLENYTS